MDADTYYVTVKEQTASRQLCVAGVKAYRYGVRMLNGTVDVYGVNPDIRKGKAGGYDWPRQ